MVDSKAWLMLVLRKKIGGLKVFAGVEQGSGGCSNNAQVVVVDFFFFFGLGVSGVGLIRLWSLPWTRHERERMQLDWCVFVCRARRFVGDGYTEVMGWCDTDS